MLTMARVNTNVVHARRYKHDPWLWDLDWTVQSTRFLKTCKSKASTTVNTDLDENAMLTLVGDIWPTKSHVEHDPEPTASTNMQAVLDTHKLLAKIQPHMPGYPAYEYILSS
jgi:hypothetical protein